MELNVAKCRQSKERPAKRSNRLPLLGQRRGRCRRVDALASCAGGRHQPLGDLVWLQLSHLARSCRSLFDTAQRWATRAGRPIPAHQQIPVGLPVLRRHDHINDRIDAGRQIDEQIAHDVQVGVLLDGAEDLGRGDRQIADDEGAEDDEDHFEQTAILGGHATRVEDRGARRVDGGVLAAVDAAERVLERVVAGRLARALDTTQRGGQRASQATGERGEGRRRLLFIILEILLHLFLTT